MIDAKSNLRETQDWLDIKYVDSQCDTFKIDSALGISCSLKDFHSHECLCISEAEEDYTGQSGCVFQHT